MLKRHDPIRRAENLKKVCLLYSEAASFQTGYMTCTNVNGQKTNPRCAEMQTRDGPTNHKAVSPSCREA